MYPVLSFECSKPAGYLTHPPLRDIDTSARHKLEETIRLEKAIFHTNRTFKGY